MPQIMNIAGFDETSGEIWHARGGILRGDDGEDTHLIAHQLSQREMRSYYLGRARQHFPRRYAPSFLRDAFLEHAQ